MKRTRLLIGVSVFWLALTMVLDGLNSLVLPVQLLQLGSGHASATTLGLLSFTGFLAALVVQPMAGEWSDRLRGTWGRTGLIAGGLLAMLASLFALGVGRNLVALFVAYLAIQVSASLACAAQSGFIPDMLPYDKTGQALAMKRGMETAGSALGFIVLGSFLGAAAVGPALMVVGAVLTGAFLLAVVLVGERPRPHGVRHSSPTWDDLYRFDFRTHRRFMWLIASRGLFLLGMFVVTRFLVLFLGARFGLEPGRAAEQAGMLLGGLVLVTTLFAPLGHGLVERLGHGFVMIGGLLTASGGVLALTLANGLQHVLLGVLLVAFGAGAFLSANTALTTDLTPATQASKFNGLANISALGAAAIAGLFGPLLDLAGRVTPGAGYTFLFGGAALVVMLSMLGVQKAIPSRNRQPIGEPVPETVREG